MANLVISGDTSGSVTLAAPAVSGSTTLTLPTTSGTILTTASTTGVNASAISTGTLAQAYGGTGTTTGYYGFKNRIINGAMVIDQRNAGASVTPASGTYTLDRWVAYLSQASKYTIQQNAGSVTPPVGFINYLGLTVAASANVTVGATDFFSVSQWIEGFNVADLDFGTANAKTVTLSFWVRSSLTGTFGGALRNSAGNRTYPFTYIISSANTWEQKSVTIPGDTTGTWLKNNETGLQIWLSIGTGSTYSDTAGAWTAKQFTTTANGATNLISTNSATFYITGVQLEVGSTATSFDYRPYGTELALCQRYYENNYGVGYAVGSAAAYDGNGGAYIQGYQTNNAQKSVSQTFKVTKRAKPTMGFYDAAGNSGKLTTLDVGGTGTNNVNVGYAYIDQYQVVAGVGANNAAGIQVFWVAVSEL